LINYVEYSNFNKYYYEKDELLYDHYIKNNEDYKKAVSNINIVSFIDIYDEEKFQRVKKDVDFKDKIVLI